MRPPSRGRAAAPHALDRVTPIVATAVLAVLVGAAAFAYGSVEIWSSEWLLFGALLAAGVLVWHGPPAAFVSGAAGRLAGILALFVLWAFAQSVPVSRGFVRALSPRSAALYEATVPPGGGSSMPAWLLEKAERDGVRIGRGDEIPEGVADRGDPAVGRSLSVFPTATRQACLAWLTQILLFLAAARVGRDAVARYRLLWAVAGWTALWGLVAALQQAGWDGSPLWTREERPDIREVLPFVNPNHYAGFVEMGTLVALGLLLAVLASKTGRLDRAGVREALVDRAWSLPRIIALGLLVALGFVGLGLAGSRGGFLAMGAGLAFLILARRARALMVVPAAAVAVAGVAVGLVGLLAPAAAGLEGGGLTSAADHSTLLRFDAWTKTFRIFLDHPWVGTGLGTFRWAFLFYQREGEWMSFKEAHNDYLQVLAETGVVGAVLLLLAFAVFLFRILAPALRAPAPGPRWTTVALAAAVVALGVHSIVDFNLQIPANAALFSVLLGMLTAAAGDVQREEGS